MRFDDRLLDEIKSRIPVSRLIGKSVALQRAGSSFKALSPFGKEKTPSFYVHDEKRIFKDFSSGLGGDIFKWLMLTEGLSFPEAVEKLAAEAGVALPERDPETARRDQARRELIDWLEAAQSFFRDALKSGGGKEARDYLARRGVPEPDWARFEIGYAPPGWESLTKHLAGKGAKAADLIKVGLSRESDRGREPYDTFRNRVTFAIRDPAGRLVGFGARALAKDEKAKYINSPESDVFKKGEVLYRYPEARKAAASAGREAARRGLVIVEGYMDAIALAQAGVGETVASLGTALTLEQIELAWRAGPRPTLLLDGDAAGIAAGYRVAERVLPMLEPGRTIRFARLKGAKDPDDLVRAEGLDGVRRVLDGAVGLDVILWEKAVGAHPVSSPDDAAELEEAIKRDVNRIAHAGVRAHYRAALLQRFSEAYGWGSRKKSRKNNSFRPSKTKAGPHEASDFDDSLAVTRSRPFGAGAAAEVREGGRLLHALLERPAVIERVVEMLAEVEMPHEGLAALRDALVATVERQEVVDKIILERHLAEFGVEQIAAKVREEPTYARAPILQSGGPDSGQDSGRGDAAAAAAWAREAGLYHRRLHEREERQDLKTAALEGVEAGDRDVQRRFITGAHELVRPQGETADGASHDVEEARARFDETLAAFDRDVKRLGDRRRSRSKR